MVHSRFHLLVALLDPLHGILRKQQGPHLRKPDPFRLGDRLLLGSLVCWFIVGGMVRRVGGSARPPHTRVLVLRFLTRNSNERWARGNVYIHNPTDTTQKRKKKKEKKHGTDLDDGPFVVLDASLPKFCPRHARFHLEGGGFAFVLCWGVSAGGIRRERERRTTHVGAAAAPMIDSINQPATIRVRPLPSSINSFQPTRLLRVGDRRGQERLPVPCQRRLPGFVLRLWSEGGRSVHRASYRIESTHTYIDGCVAANRSASD